MTYLLEQKQRQDPKKAIQSSISRLIRTFQTMEPIQSTKNGPQHARSCSLSLFVCVFDFVHRIPPVADYFHSLADGADTGPVSEFLRNARYGCSKVGVNVTFPGRLLQLILPNLES